MKFQLIMLFHYEKIVKMKIFCTHSNNGINRIQNFLNLNWKWFNLLFLEQDIYMES